MHRLIFIVFEHAIFSHKKLFLVQKRPFGSVFPTFCSAGCFFCNKKLLFVCFWSATGSSSFGFGCWKFAEKSFRPKWGFMTRNRLSQIRACCDDEYWPYCLSACNNGLFWTSSWPSSVEAWPCRLGCG